PPPVPAGPIGLQSNQPFAVVGTDQVALAYSAATNTYTISLPGYPTGQLVTLGGNGSYNAGSSTWLNLNSTYNAITQGSSAATQDNIRVSLAWPASSSLTYTSSGYWMAHGSAISGIFAYGIPTPAATMPVTGTATYKGSVSGIADTGFDIVGSVTLAFDFGAGTLNGSMTAYYVPWDPVLLGTYTFRDTVYSSGSTTFSGSLSTPGVTGPSSFSGSFDGPGAPEFMARWNAPYLNPSTNSVGTMRGIWLGKKD